MSEMDLNVLLSIVGFVIFVAFIYWVWIVTRTPKL